jgi:hypothetical protein
MQEAALGGIWRRDMAARKKSDKKQALVDKVCRDYVIDECAKCVPTNWCDVLLTGPDAPKGPLDSRGVERLLRGVQDRIRALKSNA